MAPAKARVAVRMRQEVPSASLSAIAAELGVSRTTVARHLAELVETGPPAWRDRTPTRGRAP